MGVFKELGDSIKSATNLTGYIDTEAAERSIRSNIYFKGPNTWILAIAIIIASVGLNVNAIPVVIGAMLISPLMGPIFGLGLGLGISDMDLMKSSGKNLVVMVLISLTASFLYFVITPLSLTNPTELLARTNPTIYDVLIALFGGFAGTLEQSRKDKGTVFAGVAIATALMPPLCTAGFGLASGNASYFFGALYLFFINCLFIMLATYIGVKYLGFQQTEFKDASTGRRTKRIVTILILLFTIPSIWSAVTLIQQNRFEENALAFVEHSKSYGKSFIYDYKIDHTKGSKVELFFTGEDLDDNTKQTIYQTAARYDIKQEQVIINDHTSEVIVQNDSEVIKNIYDRMDREIAMRDNEIKRLTAEIEALRHDDIPYSQVAREIKATHPSIHEVHITSGECISDAFNNEPISSTIVAINANEQIDSTEQVQLEQWLKARINNNNLILIDLTVEPEAELLNEEVVVMTPEEVEAIL